jgi:serine/threonine protein kinase
VTEPRKELRNGRYTLVRVLGEGGQAETFEAIDNGIPKSAATQARLAEKWGRYIERARAGEDRASQAAADRLENAGRLVAVKSFRVGKAKAWKDVELAEREARTLASLDHPKLPKYIEHFEEDGALYLVMEKVEGESLASLRKQRILGSDDVVRMLEDIADALRYLHGRSPLIIHRDIKPANIIRRLDGSYALVDFGAVRDRLKPAGGSTVVGTFGYMAPEQFQGRASPKSDVYGLGATAIAMLTGTEPEDLPHEGLGIDVERALPKGTPKSLVRALSSMLVPDPDRRIGSVDEALALLRLARCELARPRAKDAEPLTRKDKRTAKRERKRAAREDKARRRALARTRRPPFLPRTFAKLGLLIAMLAVWIAVGLVVPSVLVALSLLFGAALRRAAHANVRAARRAQSRLNDAWSWLSGERPESAEPPRVRVPSGLDEVQRARVVSEAEKAEPNRTEEAEFDEEFEPDRHRFRPERRR